MCLLCFYLRSKLTEMHAVFETGGRQHRVTEGDVIEVNRLATDAGQAVTFDKVFMVHGDGNVQVGAPLLGGASIEAEIVEHKRGPKLIAFKMRRRKGFRKKIGHRQELSVIRINKIVQG